MECYRKGGRIMKPTLDQISKVPMAPIIPTVGREYDGRLIIVHWSDDTVSEYEFDRGPSNEQHFSSPTKFEANHGARMEEYGEDAYLTSLFKRHFIRVNKVYTADL
jgi:hypothetical protein